MLSLFVNAGSRDATVRPLLYIGIWYMTDIYMKIEYLVVQKVLSDTAAVV